MLEIRFHGRGGQGTVVASKALAFAVAREGRYVQTFPEYGVERRGAPVVAFTRIDDEPIYIRSKIYEPDHLVVLEPTLIGAIDVTEGLKPGGWIIINSEKKAADFPQFKGFKVATFDATSVAVKYRLGSAAAPIVNTAILGALSKITGFVGIDAVREAVHEISPVKKDENVKAAEEAYETAVREQEQP
ncbi:2-oxoacid:acceptor oxidoreductase family protein [candidate division WOR-3 bacterium]|nr:2-oxoacid:acceptor oxidoreductase family protein [candidate division WOR-3 bacterium]